LIVKNYIELLGLHNAINRADRNAFGRITVTYTFHAGCLIDNVEDAIAFCDGLGGTFGYARAASDAVFFNFHCHGLHSFLIYNFSSGLSLVILPKAVSPRRAPGPNGDIGTM
jgi:hypothetical protein